MGRPYRATLANGQALENESLVDLVKALEPFGLSAKIASIRVSLANNGGAADFNTRHAGRVHIEPVSRENALLTEAKAKLLDAEKMVDFWRARVAELTQT